MTPARFRHTLGVAQTAADLAGRWAFDVEKAYITGILHDCARELSSKFLLKKVLDFGIVVDEITRSEPVLLHSYVGAEMARQEFDVIDDDVLNAIRYHTTGRAGMSLLEQIIFVADYTEPGRIFPGVERVRELAQEDLGKAMLSALEQTMRHLMDRGRLIHPDTLAARNHFVQK